MTAHYAFLDRQNRIVLLAIQALLGLISRNIIAIAVDAMNDEIVLRFWVAIRNKETDEDIREALSELETLFIQENPSLTSEVYLGPPSPDWPEWAGRMIYWAKTDT